MRHLLAVAIRHRQKHGRIQPVEYEAKVLCGVLGGGAIQLNQHGVELLAIDQGADLGLVSGALDEVPLPVARHQSLADIDGTFIDAGFLRDVATAVGAGAARRQVLSSRSSSSITRARSSPRGVAYRAA